MITKENSVLLSPSCLFNIQYYNLHVPTLQHKSHHCLQWHEPHEEIESTGVVSGAVTKTVEWLEEQELFGDLSKGKSLVNMLGQYLSEAVLKLRILGQGMLWKWAFSDKRGQSKAVWWMIGDTGEDKLLEALKVFIWYSKISTGSELRFFPSMTSIFPLFLLEFSIVPLSFKMYTNGLSFASFEKKDFRKQVSWKKNHNTVA